MPVQSHFWYKMFDLTDVPLKLALVIPGAYERYDQFQELMSGTKERQTTVH